MMNLAPKTVEGSSSSMDLAFLPSEIIIDILSRLPVKTVIHCKCVCKSWLELLETPEFSKNHLSKSVPGLIVCHDVFSIHEFVDELELDHHGLHYSLVMKFEKTKFTGARPHDAMGIEGSANGLVLLCGDYYTNAAYVCNPITREFIKLPFLVQCRYSNSVTDEFGLSIKSGQYKVVRILQECVIDHERCEVVRISRSECWVYTLGTGAWRSIASCPLYYYDGNGRSSRYAFFNGNLHWMVKDINDDGSYMISCFDLETEVFSTFSPPPPLRMRKPSLRSDPLVFEDCLCICDIIINSEIVIWVLKEYGNDKSWTKQFVFARQPDFDSRYLHCIYPLKLFKDGDILLLWDPLFLLYYSKKTNTAQKLDMFELHENIEARLHVSSFLTLGSFAMETVRKF